MSQEQAAPEGQNPAADEAGRALSEQQLVRRQKLAKLQAEGCDPFATLTWKQSHHSKQIKDDFEAMENQTVSLAGRIMSFRDIGKAAFVDLQDRDGRIQLYVNAEDLGAERYAHIKTWDVGDIVGVEGFVFKTRRGEISVHAKRLELLAKALEPLPEKFHGLKDPEIRYRRRYLDLIMNNQVMDTFKKRTAIIKAIRRYLDEREYIEVDTPILSTIASGAAARPFVTKSNALNLQLYLRIATELYLKRCIVGGMERVYDMGKNFRNEGIDIRHNPEFTMIELYQAFADYNDMMSLLENLVAYCAQEVCGSAKVVYQGTEIDFTPPWRRLTMMDAVKEYGQLDFSAVKTDLEAQAIAKQHGLEHELKKKLKDCTKGDILNAAFEKFAEEHLIQPTFICDYPTDISPLTKQKPGDPTMTERFEAFVYAREIANAYSELNDPIIQLERFQQQARERELGDDEAYMFDEDFIASLEVGMPPTGGMGIGIDRVIMFLTDAYSIRDVILFPTMKPQA
ncbi:MAG: lysine--tRNA ligase [Spirochaetes bacterium GWD1_61_31]|nr:MAG: lysine--tRNA ligase [Spirochaetes bacterium GWB1_60_80]OHD35656.1 MAG: lysine--tRNA ligase [Spirochaetes bacterium GWC1_61_12]OHD41220.1 MAG: lysine--tRNA ligase [Spirochaetes bacterium GWD1_61_31]OHD45116.1 MAG: lysine--tRNA ligase [Spirochaetes bacterium GWE1_60_18]HAP43594.1 lysine--tRNA ligase [Spirochaetaceae bacterium]